MGSDWATQPTDAARRQTSKIENLPFLKFIVQLFALLELENCSYIVVTRVFSQLQSIALMLKLVPLTDA
jgi:hypothetical protein